MDKITAVIVTFNPDKEIKETARLILKQVESIVIVDNGSKELSLEYLKELENEFNKIKVIYNNKNIGLSKAQNIGIKSALENGSNWVLIMDDDSKPDINMSANMLNFYNGLDAKEKKKTAILYPNIMDKNTGEYSPFLVINNKKPDIVKCNNNEIIKPYIVMASGSLIKSDLLNEIGLMDESFFIDQIDVDFSLRVINKGYNIFVIGNALLYHSLGKRTVHKFWGKEITPTNHSHFRCYNIFRNRIIIWRRYIKTNFTFVKIDIMIAGYHIFKIVLFEKMKLRKLWMIIKGIVTGIFADKKWRIG